VLPLLELDDVAECVRTVVREELEKLERRLKGSALRSDDVSPAPSLLTQSEVSELSHLSVRTIRRLELGGEMPASIRIGSAKRWRRSEIEVWLDGVQTELRKRGSHGSR
jgi:predicted DNA-binding transcriptional regulator AlpA